jgi:hypothetical protein
MIRYNSELGGPFETFLLQQVDFLRSSCDYGCRLISTQYAMGKADGHNQVDGDENHGYKQHLVDVFPRRTA